MSIYRSPSADRQRNQRAINNYIGAEQYDPAAVVTTGQSATTCTHAGHHGKAGATYPRYKTLPWCLLAAGLGGWSSPVGPGVPPPATAFTNSRPVHKGCWSRPPPYWMKKGFTIGRRPWMDFPRLSTLPPAVIIIIIYLPNKYNSMHIYTNTV